MIITRTPFRISFFGGGTDLPAFYRREYGAVFNTAIDKYMYITVKRRFDHTIRISYSRTEQVDRVEEIQHPIVRECLKLTEVTDSIEITSISDIPAGTGLGSSSSFTVGLLHALFAHRGRYVSPATLAELACKVEIDILGEPVGKQDQYIAAYGGMRHIQFEPDETVSVATMICPTKARQALNKRLMMFYMGGTRSASKILKKQKKNTANKFDALRRMRDMTLPGMSVLQSDTSLHQFGELMHQSWTLKRELAGGISNPTIDRYYDAARAAGAVGGKVLGAGGAGFLLLYVELKEQPAVRQAMQKARQVEFSFESQGSHILFVGEDSF